jgi:pimeloyl-ACP methyl ester carboxylesterase
MKHLIKHLGRLILLITITLLITISYLASKTYAPDMDQVKLIENNTLLTLTELSDHYLITPRDIINTQPTIIFYTGGLVSPASYLYNISLIAVKTNSRAIIIKPPLSLAIIPSLSIKTLIDRYGLQGITLAGHSLGGVAACYAYDKYLPINKIILMGSYCNNDISQEKVKVIALNGSRDEIISRTNLEKAKKNTPNDSQYITIEGANHSIWGSYGQQQGDGPSDLLRSQLINQVLQYF